ncbi:MAG: DUF1778 domain-containing protein [Nitrospirota bacterium]
MRKRLTVRITEDEHATIQDKAAIAGLSMSKYLIKAGLSRQIKPPLPEEVRRAIAGFGRNLNQLAHKCNINDAAPEAGEVRELREDVRELLEAIADRA